MKILVTMMLLFVSTAALCRNASNDFGQSASELKQLTSDEIFYRLHITGQIFVLSADGEKLVNMANETREWQFGGAPDTPLESNWSFEQKGYPVIALKQKWSIDKSGKISVEIAQYENIERGVESEVKYGKLIREEKFVLKDFAPIDWTVPAGEQKLVVRLTPNLWQNIEPIDVGALPLGGKNMLIYAHSGKFWAYQINPDHAAAYFAVVTHEGALFLSFVHFKGSTLLGEAKGNQIKIKVGKETIFVQSETPFVPNGVQANVYGIVSLKRKTLSFNSVLSYSSSNAEEFLKIIGRE